MANSAEYTAENAMALALNQKSMKVVSTLMRKAVLLAAFGIFNASKTDAVYGVGMPESDTILQGYENDAARVEASADATGSYEPLIQNIILHNFKRSTNRDTVPVASVGGTPPTYTITVDANGSITAVTCASGSGYSGSPPTLVVYDSVGSAGHGCELEPTMSGGTVSTVSVQSIGVGYTTPVIVTYAGLSEAEQFARPIFHWSKVVSEGEIYKSDIAQAVKLAKSNGSNENDKILDLTGDSIVKGVGSQATVINHDMWNGSPSSESAFMWSKQYGLKAAIDDGTNTAIYAGVERTTSDGTTGWWRSYLDTGSKNWNMDDFVNDANLEKGLSERSGGIDLVVVHPRTIKKWKKYDDSLLVNVNTDDKLREMAQYGFRTEVLKYGNTYAIGDPMCDLKTGYGLNSASFLIRFLKEAKFAPTELWDMEKQDGGKEAWRYLIKTQWMFACVAPNLNIKYTNLSA